MGESGFNHLLPTQVMVRGQRPAIASGRHAIVDIILNGLDRCRFSTFAQQRKPRPRPA